MSIIVLDTVWHGYKGNASAKLTLLALADWSDDQGRSYPSIASLAEKTCLSRSQSQRVVHGLIEQGVVAVIGNQKGGAPGTTRRYQIAISRLTGRTDDTPTGSAHATPHAVDGSHGCAETGSAHATLTVIEPSVAISPRARKKSKALPLADWLAQVAAAGMKAVPDDDPVRSYAVKAGIPDDYLRLCWFEFRDRYTQPDAKTYTEWRAVFRNAVRGNWLKLWFFDQDGQCLLTTAGKQAMRHLENAE